MVEVEFEKKGIEDLIIEDDDDLTQVTIRVDRSEFDAYVSQVKYGEIVKIKNNKDAAEVGQQILKKHLFNSKKERMDDASIDKLPAGAIVQITKAILDISGIGEVDNLKDF